ncbi:TonB-dependent receptor family protein [Pedobacter cryophilus]|nr:TonB-dependent receptor [Pedobacter cryophilus]
MRKLSVLYLAFLPLFAVAQKAENEVLLKKINNDSLSYEMPQVTVVGTKDKLFSRVPGSVSIVTKKDLLQLNPLTVNEVLRKITGLNVVDEEGAGLRVNIGIRGLDPDRSRSVLMLEDGVPIALNPYGEPEMYFTPAIDKMAGLEILKGSGQILFGPQTIGGVVNFFTADPPSESQTRIKLNGGDNGLFSSFISHGNTFGKTGFIISYLHKRADNLGTAAFSIHDLSAKIKLQTSEKSNLGLKIGFYDEISNSTYVGLTQNLYDNGGQDFLRIAPEDRLPIRRYNASLTHQLFLNNNIKLQTTAFAYTITRNWQRQEFSFTRPNDFSGVVYGDTNIPNGALYLRNTTGNRNRQFEVVGIEPKLNIKHLLFNKENVLETGVRFIYERANEQFIIGAKPDASSGNIRDNEIRTGRAFSLYAQNKIDITSKLNINIGARLENYDYNREILRGRFRVNGVNNVVRDTSVLASSNTLAFIPGAGLNYNLSDKINLFAGAHKGFAPPRVKDAITSEGIALNLDAELSTNYELGSRFNFNEVLTAEITAFVMDFQNQIIPVSQSSGNLNATGLVNGGQTLHQGLELGFKFDFGKLLNSKNSFYIENSSTFQKSVYSGDRFVGNANLKNLSLPYAPNKMIWTALGTNLNNGFGARVSGNFIDNQFTDEINSITPSANGRTGQIDSRFIIDGNLSYKLPKINANINIAAKNLTDQRYISSRRPEGIRVGLPRLITLGFDYTF